MLAWMVIAQLHLPVNSAKSVLGCSNQTDEQSSRSEKWRKFSCNVEYAWHLVKNTSGRRAAEVFMETTEEHKVLRPIKRCKKKHKSHTCHGTRSIAWEKLILPSLVAWTACTKIRDAPAERRRESKVQRSSTRIEMPFLWCFSATHWERILAASRAQWHNLSHIMVLKRTELITPTKRG